ncbi:glycoside hydrolase family 16 protein [Aeoliella mucimassa]|nr:glycoside hydrolase family 16 protein [Aeoliella mucimassa]
MIAFTTMTTISWAADPQEELPTPPEGQDWKLIWNDEFDGDKLDESKWDIPEYKRRAAWWSAKAVALDGEGHLAIKTLREGDRYLNACIRSRDKFEHKFGYYVARVKLQKEPGHWTAFWLYNDSVNKVGDDGRDGTEIDIFEKITLDDQVHHALHWDGYGDAHQNEFTDAEVPGVMEGWHTFGLWWKADEYVFYVDGKPTWTTTASGVCQVPLYVKFSDEIGEWSKTISTAKLPDEFQIDYVRVYDLEKK